MEQSNAGAAESGRKPTTRWEKTTVRENPSGRLDSSSEAGAYADRRLREDEIIWFTTVRPDGQPQPVPVWFLWDGETVFVYIRDISQKLRNLRRNPRVALTLDSQDFGDSVVRLDGIAEIIEQPVRPIHNQAFLDKYLDGIYRIGRTPESFDRDYRLAVRVRPERWQIWWTQYRLRE